MKNTSQIKHTVPQSAHPFRFSRAALGLLFATTVLGVVLVISTLQNINREQTLMESFLIDKAETIIRSIEAGSRATMRHHMGTGDPINTLLSEYSEDRDIHYVSIITVNGEIIRHVGSDFKMVFSKDDLEKLHIKGESISKTNKETGIFSLSTIFKAEQYYSNMHMYSALVDQPLASQTDKNILSVGLLTRQFDIARKRDVRHTIFMGAILFLVSTSGLYFLFLYHKVSVTSSNLADMKLYTDNIIESIPVGIITLNSADKIVSCNKNTEELFGYPLSSFYGKEIHYMFPSCSASLKNTCDGRRLYESECRDSKGKMVPLRVSCSPLVNNDDEQIGKVLIIRDMSFIKEMKVRLERSRRMAALGKMAAGIAHEIRNPLGTLRGFAQFFGNQENTNNESKNYSKLMISEIDRLNQTVSGLLQFSRPRDPQLKNILIDELFNKTVSMMASDVASKSVEVHCQNDTNIQVRVDPDLLLQVLMNLVKNSINATSPGGIISLICVEDEHFVKITVADNGCGMSDEIREKMFDPFFTTFQSGTGLGVAVSHQIIEQQGGYL